MQFACYVKSTSATTNRIIVTCRSKETGKEVGRTVVALSRAMIEP